MPVHEVDRVREALERLGEGPSRVGVDALAVVRGLGARRRMSRVTLAAPHLEAGHAGLRLQGREAFDTELLERAVDPHDAEVAESCVPHLVGRVIGAGEERGLRVQLESIVRAELSEGHLVAVGKDEHLLVGC